MILQFNDDIFPDNLRLLRKKRGLSQIALARQTGISIHYLRGIEKGHLYSQLTFDQYMKLCCALQVSPSVLGVSRLAPTTD